MRLRPIAAALLALWAAAGCGENECTCPDGAGGDSSGDSADAVDVDLDADAETGADRSDAAGGDAEAEADDAEADVPPPPRFSFAVIADSQFATTSCTSGVAERLAVPRVIVDLAPDFVLEAGDLVDRASEAGAYDNFQDCYAPFLPLMPFFPTMGNHDAAGGGITAYKAYLEQRLRTDNPAAWSGDYAADFATWYEDDPTVYSTDFGAPTHTDTVPSGVSFKTFYAFRHANAYFVSLELGTRWWSNTPTDWLDRHLAEAQADPTIDHVFVFLHHPIYSTTMADTGDGECTGPVREHYDPLFHARDVTMVFSGHAHVYDRFWVPDDGHRTADAPLATYPHDGNGVHYVVTGGAGGPLPTCSPMPSATGVVGWEYTQARGCGYHVTLVEIDGPRLTVRVLGVEGGSTDYTTSEWDRFTIE